MAVLVLLISVVAFTVLLAGIKGALALALIAWCFAPLFEGKKIPRSRFTAAVIIAATTVVLWWKVGWVLAVAVGATELVAALVWRSEKEQKESLRQWASSLFED